MLTRLHHIWHRFSAHLNQALIESCIDPDELVKLQKKVEYHQYQLLKKSI